MKNPLLDLYSDYLISSFAQTTATGLSLLLDNEYSHDQITRFLSAYKCRFFTILLPLRKLPALGH
jgi:hypothetical protein